MQTLRNILIGFIGGILLALGLPRACDRIAGKSPFRYLGSGSPGRRAEDRLWMDVGERIDSVIGRLDDIGTEG